MNKSLVILEQILVESKVEQISTNLKAKKSELNQQLTKAGIKVNRTTLDDIILKGMKELKPHFKELKKKGLSGGKSAGLLIVQLAKKYVTAYKNKLLGSASAGVGGGITAVLGLFTIAGWETLKGTSNSDSIASKVFDTGYEMGSSIVDAPGDVIEGLGGLFILGAGLTIMAYLSAGYMKDAISRMMKK